MEQNRINYFDAVKGFGIVLMIIGHFGVGLINKFIYSFHMPLFFICSGYFLKPTNSIKELIVKKGKQLLVPYYFTCLCIVIGSIFNELIKGQSFSKVGYEIGQWLIASLYASGNIEAFGIRRIGAIWFLWALFIAILFFQALNRYKQSSYLILLIGFVGLFTGNQFWLPLSVQPAMTSLLFLYTGYILKQRKAFETDNLIIYVFCTVLWLICILTCDTNMAKNLYSHSILNVIGAIGGSFLIIKVCQLIEIKGWIPRIRRAFVFLGRNSLIILCFHNIELNLLNWNSVYNSFMGIGINRTITYIICFIIKMLLLYFCVFIVHRFSWLRYIYSVPHSNAKHV